MPTGTGYARKKCYTVTVLLKHSQGTDVKETSVRSDVIVIPLVSALFYLLTIATLPEQAGGTRAASLHQRRAERCACPPRVA